MAEAKQFRPSHLSRRCTLTARLGRNLTLVDGRNLLVQTPRGEVMFVPILICTSSEFHVKRWGMKHPRLGPWIRINGHSRRLFDLSLDEISVNRSLLKAPRVYERALLDSFVRTNHATGR